MSTSFSMFTNKKIDDIFVEMNTTKDGLNSAQVNKLLAQYGLNEISGKETQWYHILGRQFKSPFIYILLFAALLALFMGEMVDGLMILGFIFINTILGFSQEYHSEKALKLLKKFISSKVKVKRNGNDDLIDGRQLVLGDIIIVETGDIIPADVRFFECNGLTVDESVLTGESMPVDKNERVLMAVTSDLNQAKNIGFSSTTVVSGRGVGVVIAAGGRTEMGSISQLTVDTRRESPFEKGIMGFSRFILRMILVILVLLFVANLLIKGENANLGELILFSIALAVSVIPEALPVVTTLSLSRGALRLARKHVVVKRLSAVEDLGSIEVLCTDKTGTITENKMQVEAVKADDEKRCLFLATAASSFLAEGKSEPNNAFDLALWNALAEKEKLAVKSCERISEIPFDPVRRRNSVLTRIEDNCQMIVRGAVESVLAGCKNINLTEWTAWEKEQGRLGRRTIAVAMRPCPTKKTYEISDETDLQLVGIIAFVDPIKSTTSSAINHAEHLGVAIKIITGDSLEVAGAVAYSVGLVKDPGTVLAGMALMAMSEKDQLMAVEKYQVFARVSPAQKYKIIQLLQKKYEVGFLGEGINDAPALKLANVALVVDHASDIARDAADIILLNSSLAVIIDGIRGGREVFANTVKYLKTTLISNFGNFYAIAIVSLLINFLPMLPVQILLLNLLSDFPMIAISMDSVDRTELRRPRCYNIRDVVLMAIILGLVSTVFDFLFFAIFRKYDPAILQTNWFIGSVLTELALIYSVRTHLPFWRARFPSKILVGLSVLAVLAAVLMPYTSLGEWLFKFHAPSVNHLLIIFAIVGSYFMVTEILKLTYYRYFNPSSSANRRITPDKLLS